MFDFENLEVYKKSKDFYTQVSQIIIKNHKIDTVTKNQLKRAALSVVLNIAEGSSRFSKADKKNFSVISRGSVFECVAIFDLLKTTELLPVNEFNRLYCQAEEISKMLFSMIKNLEKKMIFNSLSNSDILK